MKKIKVFIVDDERSARDLLKSLLADLPWILVLGEADNVDQALSEIKEKKPDVILLDIQMPRKDGFVLVEKLFQYKIQVEIIFITAFEKYAIQAIRASAFDYLLKPAKKAELLDTLKKLSEKVNTKITEEKFSRLILELSDQKKIKFRYRTGFIMIDPDEIIYCQADSNYSVLQLESGKSLTVSINLGKVEEILPYNSFCRISRSALVNLKYINRVDRKSMTCELFNNVSHTLSLSKKYLQNLEERCDQLFTIK